MGAGGSAPANWRTVFREPSVWPAARCWKRLLVRHALGMPGSDLDREDGASGVMMIPVPKTETLEKMEGEESGAGDAQASRTYKSRRACMISLPHGPKGQVIWDLFSPEQFAKGHAEAALRQAQCVI